jgi:hypothetical protein
MARIVDDCRVRKLKGNKVQCPEHKTCGWSDICCTPLEMNKSYNDEWKEITRVNRNRIARNFNR